MNEERKKERKREIGREREGMYGNAKEKAVVLSISVHSDIFIAIYKYIYSQFLPDTHVKI